MYLADTPSRVYLPSSKNTQRDFEMVNVLKILPVSEEKHDEILRHISKDKVLQLLKEVTLTGFPADKKKPSCFADPYYSYRDELSVYDGLIFKGRKPCHFTCPALSDHETGAQLPHRNQWMSKKNLRVSLLAKSEC